jgi:hypothetical protein
MMETINEERTVIFAEPESGPKAPFEERINARKTIVYVTLVDPAVIKIAGENLKGQIFAKYGFLRTSPNEVTIASIDKHYEPYIRISGKYTIDYNRKHVWTVKVNDDVSEVILGIDKFKPKRYVNAEGEAFRGIEISGEERVKKEAEASLTLDGDGRKVTLEELPSAPSEKNPQEVLAKSGAREVLPELDLSILRTRIFKRPTDISWIASEIFEVNERLVIYVPRFRVLFKNVKTGKEKTAEFDGVTGKLIRKNVARVA